MEIQAQSSSTARRPRLSCLVCDEPLHQHRAPVDTGELLCSSPHCHQIARRRPNLAPSVFARLVEVHRRHRHQQRARAEEAARRLAERRAIEAQENVGIRDSLQAQSALLDAPHPPVALPTGLRRLEPLPEHRREAYRVHLESIVAAALSKPETGDADPPAVADSTATIPLAAQLCARCGGGCCSQGGERAYLSPDSIRRVLRTHKEWQPGQLVESYLARLAPETIAGSCVNQTATGCSLPRDMRSDTCNDFHCPSLRSWHAACSSGEHPRAALAIQRGFDHWTQLRSADDNPVTGVYVVAATVTQQLTWPVPKRD